MEAFLLLQMSFTAFLFFSLEAMENPRDNKRKTEYVEVESPQEKRVRNEWSFIALHEMLYANDPASFLFKMPNEIKPVVERYSVPIKTLYEVILLLHLKEDMFSDISKSNQGDLQSGKTYSLFLDKIKGKDMVEAAAMSRLITHDILYSWSDDKRQRLFWEAAYAGNLPVVQAFFESGASLDRSIGLDSGSPPLQAAALGGHTEIVGYLLEKGADKNRRDMYGQSPLITTVCSGHIEVVRQLLSAGVDIGCRRITDGASALDIAQKLEYQEIASLLTTYISEK